MRASRGTFWCMLLSLVGIGLAGYLSFIHVGFLRGELLGGAACGSAGSAFNCHAVTIGSWGVWLGMPLSLWGILGYLLVFALSLMGRQSTDSAEHAVTLIFLLSLAFVGLDLFLLSVMAFVIQYYCLLCLLTYAVNLSLVIVSARSLPAPWPQAFGRFWTSLGTLIPSRARPAGDLFWGLLLVGVAGIVGVHAATTFIAAGKSANRRTQIRNFVTQQRRVSVATTGDPTIGPPGAPVEFVEFSDFFCPSCQKAAKMNAIILANHRKDALFVFKHFPLDTACNETIGRMVHPGACRVAAASECAHLQGKFWPFHDLVFEKGHDYNLDRLEDDIRAIGADVAAYRTCMETGEGMRAVKEDIAEAGKINVRQTPTYVINGIPVPGGLSPSAFDDFAAVLKQTTR